jgi:hypothetical protein
LLIDGIEKDEIMLRQGIQVFEGRADAAIALVVNRAQVRDALGQAIEGDR